MMKTYKNDFLTFDVQVGKRYEIADDFAVANYIIKQVGKNWIKAQIADTKVYKTMGIVNIDIYTIDRIQAI